MILPLTLEFRVESVSEAGGGKVQAKLSSGAVITVPEFIKKGNIIKVNTQEESYVERITSTTS